MTNDQIPFPSFPSFGMLGVVVFCMLMWGGFLFLATYLAVLVVVAVATLGWWAVKRIMLMYRLWRLEALRVTPQARTTRRFVVAQPRVA